MALKIKQSIQGSFEIACQNGQIEKVVDMLEGGEIDVDGVNKYGSSPLILASLKGNTEIVNILLEHFADINMLGPKNWTPLHCATFFGHVETVTVLLNHGAKVDIANCKGNIPGECFDKSVPVEKCMKIQDIIKSHECCNMNSSVYEVETQEDEVEVKSIPCAGLCLCQEVF
mmetsp:Transcript_7976/g.10619  ORF Transcript_7976/g.10619 Transcript_7976/m.10619 type:complete len:172 (+) Transcript_7976:42-557(+)|eukprot:CAMPEP_0117759738 /NCGR_PEP_ID=MMETSP0947-20121206/16187_1 /TAXON_ID=44440 /ORGANISM="Chattonella subsalsa, Strain CCMP2191" /LENGTH=171 /DNA_ID=CAMNT_0005580243 /DNA_START=65 /DNA_END=580 /DNA_ORIENTATION=+